MDSSLSFFIGGNMPLDMETKIKPVHITCQRGVTEMQLAAVQEALRGLMWSIGLFNLMPIANHRVWRGDGYEANGQLIERKSIDWYLKQGREHSPDPGQLNAERMLRLLLNRPWQDENHGYYDLLVTADDLNTGSNGPSFVIGYGAPFAGAIVSVSRFECNQKAVERELIKTLVYHEFAHVFGAPRRDANVTDCLGLHCTNPCVVQQGLTVPTDWLRLTKERQARGTPFCRDCLDDMRRFMLN